MNPDISLRLLWSLAIVAVGLLSYLAYNQLLLKRAQYRSLGLESTRAGQPVLLYFTTPNCMPCKTIQRPAIQRLKERMGDQLQLVEVDASERPDVANHWGVLSVPTTLIIDRNGVPRHINHGVAPLDKLTRQMANLTKENK